MKFSKVFSKIIKKDFIVVTFILFGIFSFAKSANATNYCVSASGTATQGNSVVANSAACTGANNTSAMSMTTFKSSTFVSGDTVYFTTSGGVFNTAMTIPSSGSSSNSIITYQGIADGAGGAYPQITISSGISINTSNRSYINISGFNILYNGTTPNDIHVFISGAVSYVTLSNLTINGNGYGYGIDSASAVSNITLNQISISNIGIYYGVGFTANGNSNISINNLTTSGGRGMYLNSINNLSITNVTSNSTISPYNSLGILSGSGTLSINNYNSTGSYLSGLYINSSSFSTVTISTTTISSAGLYGIYISTTTVSNYMTITNPTVTGTAGSIAIYLRNITGGGAISLLNGSVYNNLSSTGIVIDQVPGITIRGFNPFDSVGGGIYNNGVSGITVLASAGNSSNMTIDRNWIYNNGFPDTDHGVANHDGIDMHSSCYNEVISNNLIIHNANAALALVLDSTGIVYNNTIINNGIQGYTNRGGFYNSGTGSWKLQNNIFVNNSPYEYNIAGTALPPVTISDNNVFYHDIDSNPIFYVNSGAPQGYALSAWGSAFNQDLHSYNINPGFNNSSGSYSTTTDFTLASSSVAIDGGVSTTTTNDFSGNPIYGNPIGVYSYTPTYIQGTDSIDIGAGARIYGDGKFRNLVATSSSGIFANMKIAPQGGTFLVYDNSRRRSAWLDVSNISEWTKSHKVWTESNASSSNMVTDHTIRGLDANANYILSITGANAISDVIGINGTTCQSVNSQEICGSDSDGKLSFEYSGGYSAHTFDLSEIFTAPVFNDIPSYTKSTSSITLTATISVSGNATSTKVGFHYGTDTNYSDTSSSDADILTGSFSQTITGLNPGSTYHFQAFATNSGGTGTSSDITITTDSLPTQVVPSSITYSHSGSVSRVGIYSPIILKKQDIIVRDLRIGSSGMDVKTLQIYLNNHGYILADKGFGSPGQETTIFGPLTKKALMRLQRDYGLPVTGFFGPLTRGLVGMIK